MGLPVQENVEQVLNNFTLTQHFISISIKLYLNKTGKPWSHWRAYTYKRLAWAYLHEERSPLGKELRQAVRLFSFDKGFSGVEVHNWDVGFKRPGSSNPAAC